MALGKRERPWTNRMSVIRMHPPSLIEDPTIESVFPIDSPMSVISFVLHRLGETLTKHIMHEVISESDSACSIVSSRLKLPVRD